MSTHSVSVLPRRPAPAPRVVWLLLALGLLAAACIRIRLLDEGEYAYGGQLLLAGVPPYTLLYNMKLPGTYAAYGLAMLLFGQTVVGARLGLLLFTAGTCLGVFQLARRFVSEGHALAAALTAAILSLDVGMVGPFGHATHFVSFFAVWGFVALCRGLEADRGETPFFAAGILLGLAVLMKQPGAAFLP